MGNKGINPDELFSDDSGDDDYSSDSEESSIPIDDTPDAIPFLAQFSTRGLQSRKIEDQKGTNESSANKNDEDQTSMTLPFVDALKEVEVRSSHRRILSITPREQEDDEESIHSLHTINTTSFRSEHMKGESSPKEPKYNNNSSKSKTQGNEPVDKEDSIEPARSYINIHASRRKFNNRLTQHNSKQQSDEARMQSLMLMNIFLNRRDQNASRFPRNIYITSKYTIWNFVFMNLFEQFSRIANFVFLLVTLVQLIPGVSPFNIWTTLLPLFFILLVTALKEAYEDYCRHKTDEVTNHVVYQRVLRDGTLADTPSCELVAGDIVVIKDQESIPADILVLACSDTDGTCYVDTSSLDGETNLKLKQAVSITKNVDSPSSLGNLNGTLACQIPSKELSAFQGIIAIQPSDNVSMSTSSYTDTMNLEEAVDARHLLLRGSILRNSNWIAGMIVYTGRLTKLSLNMNIPKFKFSNIETSLNSFVPKVLFLQLLLSFICCSAARFYDIKIFELGLINQVSPVRSWIYDFLTFFVLFSYFVPMSLYVVFEFSRTIQLFFMQNDLDMYKENEGGMHVTTSSLNEELGNVEFILSDKTGTLTKNNMKCRGFSMGSYLYNADEFKEFTNYDDIATIKQLLVKCNEYELTTMEEEYMTNFLRAIFLCNSIKPVEQDGQIILRSESADEEAIISGALKLGWKMLLRTKDTVIIDEGYPVKKETSQQNTVHKFNILNELEFSSSRQRMTVIVRDLWNNKICLYSKGADSKILSLSCDNDVFANPTSDSSCKTQSYMYTSDGMVDEVEIERQQLLIRIANFTKAQSESGYRLLLVGGKYVTEEEYAIWCKELDKAEKTMKHREESIENAFVHIEFNMSVLGATSVEDELQDHIKEDIQFLRKGGITVAMATGDKKETAVIIAKNCGLYTPDMRAFDLTGSKETIRLNLESVLDYCDYQQELKKLEYETQQKRVWNRLMNCCFTRPNQTQEGDDDNQQQSNELTTKQPYLLILDGISVDQLIRTEQAKFVFAIRHASTVICSRMSPKQKSRVILLMKNEGLCCLAIGDGANDVSMIRESSVGVGVKGKEGNAAVNNADYIIREFHHLIKLLFVHGRNNYRGNSYSVYTAFYENVTFNIPLFILSFYCMFSGQTIYSSFQLSALFLYSSPTFASFGFFYQDLSKKTLLSHPEIYKLSAQEKMFSGTRMWSYLIGAFINALVCTFIPLIIMNSTQSIDGGYPIELWSMGFCIWSNITLSILIMAAMMVPKWNLNFLSLFIIAIFFIFSVVIIILWFVQDEASDSVPIIIRSPIYYLQLLFSGFVVFLFFISVTTAFRPELWRPYAEREAIEKKKTHKTYPLDDVSVSV